MTYGMMTKLTAWAASHGVNAVGTVGSYTVSSGGARNYAHGQLSVDSPRRGWVPCVTVAQVRQAVNG